MPSSPAARMGASAARSMFQSDISFGAANAIAWMSKPSNTRASVVSTDTVSAHGPKRAWSTISDTSTDPRSTFSAAAATSSRERRTAFESSEPAAPR